MSPTTKAALTDLFIQRQKAFTSVFPGEAITAEELNAKLAAIAAKREVAGWFLAECLVMDSSYFGQRIILPFGPGCTFQQPPVKPFSPRGLASDTSVAIAYTNEI